MSMRRKQSSSILGAFLPRDKGSTQPQAAQTPPSSYSQHPGLSSSPPSAAASSYSTLSSATYSPFAPSSLDTTASFPGAHPDSLSAHSVNSHATLSASSTPSSHMRTPSYGTTAPGGQDSYYYPQPGSSTRGARAPSSASSYIQGPGPMVGRSVSGLSAAQSRSMGMSSSAAAGPSTTPTGKGGSSSAAQSDGVKRMDDVFRLVKERVFGWSYLMQWYQGHVSERSLSEAALMSRRDVHYLNTVRVSPWTLEQSLGPKALESRSRSFFVLGLNLAALLDETDAAQYCRSLLRVLEEWEAGLDGGGKVKNLFRGQKSRKSTGHAGGHLSEQQEAYTGVLDLHLPFVPDFFQVHSTTCSLIRDTYKKLLRHLLPRGPTSWSAQPYCPLYDLTHRATIIQSAPMGSRPGAGVRSDSSSSYNVESPSVSSILDGRTSLGLGGPSGSRQSSGPSQARHTRQRSQADTTDGFQDFVMGRLPEDRMLVGDGQPFTRELADLISKIDVRLKKIFSRLLHEGYELARETLDSELSMLLQSLNPGSKPLRFDLSAAMSGQGNGYRPPQSLGVAPPQSAPYLPSSAHPPRAPSLNRKVSAESSVGHSAASSPFAASESRHSGMVHARSVSSAASVIASSPGGVGSPAIISGPTRTTSRTSMSTPAISSAFSPTLSFDSGHEVPRRQSSEHSSLESGPVARAI